MAQLSRSDFAACARRGVLKQEEERFAETLSQGMALLDAAVAQLKGKQIPVEPSLSCMTLWVFPVDLTADIARERGLSIDEAGYESAMEAQHESERVREQVGLICARVLRSKVKPAFNGYDQKIDAATVVA